MLSLNCFLIHMKKEHEKLKKKRTIKTKTDKVAITETQRQKSKADAHTAIERYQSKLGVVGLLSSSVVYVEDKSIYLGEGRGGGGDLCHCLHLCPFSVCLRHCVSSPWEGGDLRKNGADLSTTYHLHS
jgi:hypothetical protein